VTDAPAGELPLRDEIFQRMDELTPAERKVARTLLARYPAAGLESTAALAAMFCLRRRRRVSELESVSFIAPQL